MSDLGDGREQEVAILGLHEGLYVLHLRISGADGVVCLVCFSPALHLPAHLPAGIPKPAEHA